MRMESLTRRARCSGLTCTSGTCKSMVATSSCAAPKPCAHGGTWQACSTQTSTYYKTSDGRTFTCASRSSCSSAANALIAYCGALVGLPIGYPCTENSQCTSENCTGWCSEVCVSDAACGQFAWCLQKSGGGFICFPNCNSTADCTDYGSGVTCQSVTSANGASVTACTL